MTKFNEPSIEWKDSKARKLVLQYLREEKIPLDSKKKNDAGKRITSKMIFDIVCSMDGGENSKYDPAKFPQRLSALRKKIKEESEEKFKEPDILWEFSQAKKNLIKYLREGSIPLDPKAIDRDGKSIAPAIVYKMITENLGDKELELYDKKKFSSRLRGAREQVAKYEGRAEDDKKHYEEYLRLHPIEGHFAYHGHRYWRGSAARRFLLTDLANNVHEHMTMEELFFSRSEYHEEYTSKLFADYVHQEIRTAKYLKTIKEKGRNFLKGKGRKGSSKKDK